MKILVFSDSHGGSRGMVRALALHRGTADAAFHLGDGSGEFLDLAGGYPSVMFAAVRGNCDFVSLLPYEDKFSLGGYKYFLAHGHRHAVGEGTSRLLRAAAEKGANVALYGHTHVRRNEYIPFEEGGVYIFNPGSISKPRGTPRIPSYGVIETGAGGILLNCAELPEV